MKKTLFILSLAFCLNTNAQVCFNPLPNDTLAVGVTPVSIISVDFNGDGFKDLATGFKLSL